MERVAAVFENELEAIKDSRSRDMKLFSAHHGDEWLWIVAVSEHQAKLALTDRIWQMFKQAKLARDTRYTELLEEAWQAGQTPEALENLE